MKRLRASIRLILVTLLTIFGLMILLVGSLLTLPLPRLRARWRMLTFRSWSRSLLPIPAFGSTGTYA